jgi:hypothetical protein
METARVRENRLPSGVETLESNFRCILKPPVNAGEPGIPEDSRKWSHGRLGNKA